MQFRIARWRADGRGRERRARIHDLPRAQWTQIYSTNPVERSNAEIERRTKVVGIFPNDASISRLVGAMMLGAWVSASNSSGESLPVNYSRNRRPAVTVPCETSSLEVYVDPVTDLGGTDNGAAASNVRPATASGTPHRSRLR